MCWDKAHLLHVLKCLVVSFVGIGSFQSISSSIQWRSTELAYVWMIEKLFPDLLIQNDSSLVYYLGDRRVIHDEFLDL